MGNQEWFQFLFKALIAVLRSMLFGGLLFAGIGLLIALAASVAGDEPLSVPAVAAIVWNYTQVGLAGGGIIGLLYGLLAQGSNL